MVARWDGGARPSLCEMLRFGGGRVRDSMWDSGPGGMNGVGLRMVASAIIYK